MEGKGKTLGLEQILAARRLIKNSSLPVGEPIFIRISLWEAIRYKLKGYKIRLVKR